MWMPDSFINIRRQIFSSNLYPSYPHAATVGKDLILTKHQTRENTRVRCLNPFRDVFSCFGFPYLRHGLLATGVRSFFAVLMRRFCLRQGVSYVSALGLAWINHRNLSLVKNEKAILFSFFFRSFVACAACKKKSWKFKIEQCVECHFYFSAKSFKGTR